MATDETAGYRVFYTEANGGISARDFPNAENAGFSNGLGLTLTRRKSGSQCHNEIETVAIYAPGAWLSVESLDARS